MKSYICNSAGSTEFCSDCEFSLPSAQQSQIKCIYNAEATRVLLQFPLFYKKENVFYRLNSLSEAVKFTLHPNTFFASLVYDTIEISSLFGEAESVSETEFSIHCLQPIQILMEKAGLNVTEPADRILSNSFL